jgi:hypothetical protein
MNILYIFTITTEQCAYVTIAVVIAEKGFDIEDNHVLGKEDYSRLVRT